MSLAKFIGIIWLLISLYGFVWVVQLVINARKEGICITLVKNGEESKYCIK